MQPIVLAEKQIALFQGGELFPCETKLHHPCQEFGGFGGRKAQVCRAQLGQVSAGAQAGER